MIRAKLIPVAWLMLFAVIVGASIGLAARANATPASDYAQLNAGRVCRTLDAHASVDGIEGIVLAIVDETDQGGYFAGEVIAESVIDVCPRYLGLLREFAAKWAPRTTLASVGGRVR